MHISWFLLSTIFIQTSTAARRPPTVFTPSGKLSGLTKYAFNRPVDVYYGIPYAEPPVGDLRFCRPVPPKPWSGIRNATAPPFPCKQTDFFVHQNYTISAKNSTEDCLYLNVWTPAKYCFDILNCGTKAVMVLIYGGSFTYGSSSWDFYDGIYMAAAGDVVVVTFNYRVGVFGFFDAEVEDVDGNQGLYDQLLALKWVKENIIYFGGDPDLVTIFGQSAGAISVGYHLLSPLSKGMFKRAIMQSGSPMWTLDSDKDTALKKGNSVAMYLGCTNDSHSSVRDTAILRCLRSNTADDVLSAASNALGTPADAFYPTYGGEFMPRKVTDMLKAKEYHPAELLIGSNKNEGTYFVYNFLASGLKYYDTEHLTKDELGFYMLFFFRSVVGNGAGEVRKHYLDEFHSDDHEKLLQRASDSAGDFLITCPTRYFAETYEAKAGRVYFYQFSHRPSFSFWPKWMGVTHFDEFPFVYAHVLGRPDLVTSREMQLSRQLVHIWTTFAKTGRTPTMGKVPWPEYTRRSPYLLDLNMERFALKRGPQEEGCNFWRKYFNESQSQNSPVTVSG